MAFTSIHPFCMPFSISPQSVLRVCSLLLLIGSLAPPSSARTQQIPDESRLHGRVTDSNGIPIAGARVQVPDSGQATVTGPDGLYRLHLPDAGATRLQISATGYRPAEVTRVPGKDSGLDIIVLERASYALPGISVIGTTRAEIARVPGATAVVGSGVLHDRAPLSVMDALRTIPGIQTADEDPFGLSLNVGFRGLPPRRSSRTLLLEDGVPILLGPYGDPAMHYAPPVEAIDRLEIIKGSSQIMNGPQTVGGVINFVTRRPPTEGTEGSATLGVGALGYRNAHLRAGMGRDGRGLSIDYTFRKGEGVRREQGHRLHNAIIVGLLPVSDRQSITVKGALWDEASQISETGLTEAEFEENPFSLPFAAAGRFNVRRYLGQAVHEVRWGGGRLQTNAYFSNTRRASWRQSGESEERMGTDDYAEDFNCAPGAVTYEECGNQGRPRAYTLFGVEPRLTLDFGEGAIGSTIDIGVRLYREDVRRRQFVGDTPTSRTGDADLTRDNGIATDVLAAFAHARLHAGSVTLSPGVRVEHLAQDIRNRFPGMEAEIEQSYTQLLPGIGVTFLPETRFRSGRERYDADGQRCYACLPRPDSRSADPADDRAVHRLVQDHNVTAIDCGTRPSAAVRIEALSMKASGTDLTLTVDRSLPRLDGGEVPPLRLPLHLSLVGRSNAMNAALAATAALCLGADAEAVGNAFREIPSPRRRMEVLRRDRFVILDDTVGHPDSVSALFEVVQALAPRRIHALFAIRGQRGARVNRRLSEAVAIWAEHQPVATLVVTRSSDTADELNQVTEAERQAFLEPLGGAGLRYQEVDALDEAVPAVLDEAGVGDLVLLLGAQGMDGGAERMRRWFEREERS